jgi:hypothetical protein
MWCHETFTLQKAQAGMRDIRIRRLEEGHDLANGEKRRVLGLAGHPVMIPVTAVSEFHVAQNTP